jgi:hypothetical protein
MNSNGFNPKTATFAAISALAALRVVTLVFEVEDEEDKSDTKKKRLSSRIDAPCPYATAVKNCEDLSTYIFEFVFPRSWTKKKPEAFWRWVNKTDRFWLRVKQYELESDFWLWVKQSESFISLTCTSIHGSYRVELRGKVERAYHDAHGRRLNLVTDSCIHHLPISDIDNVKPL